MAKRPRKESALNNYELGDILGEGSFATVRVCTRKRDGARFAIKLVEPQSTSAAEAEHERHILSTIGLHRHIVSLIDDFEVDSMAAFVLELAEGGEVFERICEKGAYSEADAASVTRQVALALAFMHSLGIAHRDLKPENLLITSDETVKVADFGFAVFSGAGHPPLTALCGTVAYMAPEMARPTGPYGLEVDLFALGNILFTLLGAYNAFDPFNDRSDDQILSSIAAGSWDFRAFPEQWSAISDGARRVISALLEPRPHARLTADGLLQDTWVATASDAPLPNSDGQLRTFNEGRKVWRAAVHAATIFGASPLTAADATAAANAANANADADDDVSAGGGSSSRASAGGGGAAAESRRALPPVVQAELRTAFALFDLDRSGHIDANEMRQAVRSLGAKPAEAERLLAAADTDGDGRISFEEVCARERFCRALLQPLPR